LPARPQRLVGEAREAPAVDLLHRDPQFILVRPRADRIGAPAFLAIDGRAHGKVLAGLIGELPAKILRHGEGERHAVESLLAAVDDPEWMETAQRDASYSFGANRPRHVFVCRLSADHGRAPSPLVSPLWGRAREGGARQALPAVLPRGQIGKVRATPTPTRPHKGGGSDAAPAGGWSAADPISCLKRICNGRTVRGRRGSATAPCT